MYGSGALSVLLGCFALGCSAQSEPPAEAEDAGFDPGPPISDAGVPLPFVVDDHFHPSGCVGPDGAACTTEIRECEASVEIQRPSGAQGRCYRFVYTPSGGWGNALFFQNQDLEGKPNWGAAEGTLLAPGATRVSFFAAAQQPGQKVKFQVGRIDDPMLAYRDTLEAEREVSLGKDFEPFDVPLAGETYDRVISAFSWVIELEPGQSAPITFFLDDVRWQ